MNAFTTLRSWFVNDELDQLRDHVFPAEQRRPTGLYGFLITLAGAGLVILTLYWAYTFTWTPVATRASHLLVIIPLIFLLYPAFRRWEAPGRRWPTLFDWLWAAAAFAVFLFTVLNEDRINNRIPFFAPLETIDIVVAVTCVVVVLEATRRTIGTAVILINLFFFVYALAGPYFPGIFQHPGVTFVDIVESIYFIPTGMFNFITGLMVTFVFVFISLGVFLAVSTGDKVFTDLALSVAGHRRGGPAKVAVISSAMMGSISGSSIANAVTTGSLTIPLMKRVGFKPHEAAAVETVSSVGGVLTPPIMGAAIFILAEFTGVPYGEVILWSILPAVLYYASLYFYVDFKAGKRNLAGLPRDQLPKFWAVMMNGGHLFIPLIVLVWMLLSGFSAFYSGAIALTLVVPVSYLRRHTRMTPARLLIALEGSARAMMTLTPIGVSAAIIYSLLTVTGLIVKLTTIILALADGSLFLAMILVAVSSYVMGMGLPVAAAYVLLAATAAPALDQLGTSLFAAHLIILWFSQDSTITPPVCITAFVSARIANAPPMKTGWHSVLMAKPLYIIPFAFAYASLLEPSPLEMGFDFVCLFVFFALMAGIVEGWMIRSLTTLERVVLVVPTIGLLVSCYGPAAQALPYFGASVLALCGAVLWMRRSVSAPVARG